MIEYFTTFTCDQINERLLKLGINAKDVISINACNGEWIVFYRTPRRFAKTK
jgi:hypothetical protein